MGTAIKHPVQDQDQVKPSFVIFDKGTGVFEVKLSNDVREILKRQTLVAMATKFGTKLAIT